MDPVPAQIGSSTSRTSTGVPARRQRRSMPLPRAVLTGPPPSDCTCIWSSAALATKTSWTSWKVFSFSASLVMRVEIESPPRTSTSERSTSKSMSPPARAVIPWGARPTTPIHSLR